MLENNFDRLRVHSITAEVDIDDIFDDDDEEEEEESNIIRRVRPTIGGPRHNFQRPKYSEAVGDARLAWQWVEGWRARLRKSGDIVEQARWEWRLEHLAGGFNEAPVVVEGMPEVSGDYQGVMDTAVPRLLRRKIAFGALGKG